MFIEFFILNRQQHQKRAMVKETFLVETIMWNITIKPFVLVSGTTILPIPEETQY